MFRRALSFCGGRREPRISTAPHRRAQRRLLGERTPRNPQRRTVQELRSAPLSAQTDVSPLPIDPARMGARLGAGHPLVLCLAPSSAVARVHRPRALQRDRRVPSRGSEPANDRQSRERTRRRNQCLRFDPNRNRSANSGRVRSCERRTPPTPLDTRLTPSEATTLPRSTCPSVIDCAVPQWRGSQACDEAHRDRRELRRESH